MKILIATLALLWSAGAGLAADSGCKFSGKWVDQSAGGYPIFDCPDTKR
jgi:hypothetical protein